MSFNPQWLWFLIPVGVVAFWCAVCGLISLVGWSQLAKSFRAETISVGPLRSFQGMMIGSARYNGALSIGVWPAGLYLRVLPIFAPVIRHFSFRGAPSDRYKNRK